MMKYQRVFGDAEPLTLMKEQEMDHYRGPGQDQRPRPLWLLPDASFRITLPEPEPGCESAAAVKAEKCSMAAAPTRENT